MTDANARATADAATSTVGDVVVDALVIDTEEVIRRLLAFGRRVGEHVSSRELDGVIDDQRALVRLQRDDPDDVAERPPYIASTCGALNTIRNAGDRDGCGRTTDDWRFAALREIESRGRMSQAFAEALGPDCPVGRAFARAEANAKTLVWRLIGCDLIKFRSPDDARDAINAAAAARASRLRPSASSTSLSSSSTSLSSSTATASSSWTFDYDYRHRRRPASGRYGYGDDDDDDPTPPLFIDSDVDDDGDDDSVANVDDRRDDDHDSGFAENDEEMDK